jgi:Undecaprenyl-phosphate glucose phosphotransferase
MQRRNNLLEFRRRSLQPEGAPAGGVSAPPASNGNEPGFASFADYADHVATGFRARRTEISDRKVAIAFAIAEFVAILAASLFAGLGYHLYLGGDAGRFDLYAMFSLLFATVYSIIMLAGDRYRILALYDRNQMLRDALLRFVTAFSVVVCLKFMLKQSDDYSRVTLLLQFVLGAGALYQVRASGHRLLAWATKFGMVRARRVILVGADDAVLSFARHFQPWNDGIHVVGVSTLPQARFGAMIESGGTLEAPERDKLANDCRRAQPDDIILVLPWDAERLIRDISLTLASVPAAIHIAPERMISWVQEPNFTSIGKVTTLSVIREPLGTSDHIVKRLFDIVASGLGLLVAAPAMLLAALAIKLQDGGPIFFRQQRHGFNQDRFDILKFRTMTVAPDDGEFRQATKADSRITPIGRFLRATNIDELPQLLNVLRGDMSLVGPRPHAVQHNEQFEDRITLYARRHNVRPGITGWAQVNGFRGPTDTLEKMDQRVDHDLYYIDNWSLWLDLRILVLTVLSRRAYRNAH